VPSSFVPDEDQGYFFLNVQLQNSASLQRTEDVMSKIQKVAASIPGIEHVTTGFSLLSLVRTSYGGFGFISMNEWGDRATRAQQFQAIKARLNTEPSNRGHIIWLLATRDSRRRHIGRIHFHSRRSLRQRREVPFR
jgi:HAE1 family hydrophobic/amphiphilic exporter-1